jgi:hypothetical protein
VFLSFANLRFVGLLGFGISLLLLFLHAPVLLPFARAELPFGYQHGRALEVALFLQIDDMAVKLQRDHCASWLRYLAWLAFALLRAAVQLAWRGALRPVWRSLWALWWHIALPVLAFLWIFG